MTNYTHRHALEQWKHYAVDRSGYISDENPYSNMSIVRALQDVRATEIKIALKTDLEMSEFMVQTLGCVEVEEMDRSECPCAPASGCYWLKVTNPIPVYCRITSVTGTVASGTNPRFTFMKWDRFQYIPKSRSKATREGLYWTIRNTGKGPQMYLYGNRNLELISISAIWEDPMAVEAYKGCESEDLEAKCNPLDVSFYTDSWMRDVIISKTWQKLLPVRSAASGDMLNDDNVGNNPLQTTS